MNRSHAPATRHLLLLLASVLAGPPLTSTATAPKVEETVVGPANQPGHYVISERGAHVAFAGAKANGKFSVIVDGVEGPEFDELLRPTGEPVLATNRINIGPATQTTGGAYNDGPVIMSADGTHHAYLGRQGGEVVVIHDGKELARGPAGRFVFDTAPLTISRGGRLLFWTETDNGMPDPLFRVVVSGKAGPWSFNASSQTIRCSADDSRYAYHYTNKDSGKAAMIVDGKDAGYFGTNPTFTADGKTLIAQMTDGKQAHLMVNGKSAATGTGVGLIAVAPIGGRWGAILSRRDANHQTVYSLVIDGKEIAEGTHAQEISFSPDGKHYAVVCRHSHGRGPDNVVIDGRRSADYRKVPERDIEWSPDSSTCVYVATTAANAPVIVAVTHGKETTVQGGIVDVPVAFPQKGGRFALTRRNAQNQGENIVDGGPAPKGAASATFVFSPDGSRLACLTDQLGSTPRSLIVDGTPVADLLTGYFAVVATGEKAPAIVFSPDGKHLVAFARAMQGAIAVNVGLWLDGKIVHPTTQQVWFPTFTPDSKHLLWAADEASTDRTKPAALVIYADGQPAARVDGSFFQRRPDIWHMDDAGTVTFLAAGGGSARRYRITAAPDTTVATLFEKGTMVAEAPKPPPVAPVAVSTPPAQPPPASRPATAAPAAAPAVKPVAAAAPAAAAGPVAPLTWNDLVRRPEARPATCTITKEFRFQSGAVVRAGSTVNVAQAKPASLVVSTTDGRTTFECKPEETDILATANAAWAQLTPAQRELTYPALLRRTDLWPYRVKLLVSYTLDVGQTRAGDTAVLLGVEGSQLLVSHPGLNILFNVEPAETDLMAQARVALASEAGATGRVIEELAAGRPVSPVDGRAMALDMNARPKLVVMYRGAGWCGPCQVFSPQLVKVLRDKSPAASEVALIFVSSDRSPAEAKAYVTEIGIDWPTIYFKSRDQLPAFNTLFGDSIPQLVVTDRHGKVLVDSNRAGTAQALKQLEQLL